MVSHKRTDINKWVPVGLIVDEKGNICEGERYFRQCPECSLYYGVPYACYEPLRCPLCATHERIGTRCLCNKSDASGADRDGCPKHGEERRVFREKREELSNRMKFEKWVRSNMEFSPLDRYKSYSSGNDMPYMDHSVQCAWAAWQAATNNSNSES